LCGVLKARKSAASRRRAISSLSQLFAESSMTFKSDPITRDHLTAFGAIIQQSARFERLVEIVVNTALGGRTFGLTALALSGLSYSGKCDALLSLMKIMSFSDGKTDRSVEIASIVKEFNTYSYLRNSIAHHTWIEGTRPNSVKPMSISARWGDAKVRGLAEDDLDFELNDLINVANKLISIHDRLRELLQNTGSIPAIEENIEETNPASNKSGSPECGES
jgi:hypothetical protein